MDYRICVLTHGWVMVGAVQDYETDSCPLVLQPCAIVRQWGTTRGLGELFYGPTSKTVLDPEYGQVRIAPSAIHQMRELDAASWEPVLAKLCARPRDKS